MKRTHCPIHSETMLSELDLARRPTTTTTTMRPARRRRASSPLHQLVMISCFVLSTNIIAISLTTVQASQRSILLDPIKGQYKGLVAGFHEDEGTKYAPENQLTLIKAAMVSLARVSVSCL